MGSTHPSSRPPAGALDDNSVDLSDAIGSVYGEAAGKQFLELWRAHIGMFVDYAEGALTGNEKQMERALADLDGYREDFGAFLESANPNLTKEAVAAALKPHVASLASAIDAVAGSGDNPFVALQEAASHMPMTARSWPARSPSRTRSSSTAAPTTAPRGCARTSPTCSTGTSTPPRSRS